MAQGRFLPRQDQVFSVAAAECGRDGPYFSADGVFSALPSVKSPNAESLTIVRDEAVPWSRSRAYQSGGVLVTNDKRVFYLTSSYKGYITFSEAGTKESHSYKLPRTTAKSRKSPRFEGTVSTSALPRREDVFAIATMPWNDGTAFTPVGLLEALSSFVRGEIRIEDSPASSEALNGVIVLKNRGILWWYTRLPTWLTLRCGEGYDTARYGPLMGFRLDR